MQKLILKCHADNEWCEVCPKFAVAEVDEGFLQKVRFLRAQAETLDVYKISKFDYTATFHAWDEDEEGNEILGEEVRTDCHMLCVASDEFWWEGVLKGSNEGFRTEEVSIDGRSRYREHNLGKPVVDKNHLVLKNEVLFQQAIDGGLTPEDFDYEVLEVASSIGSDANNGGVHGQIDFLVAQLGRETAEKIVVNLVRDQEKSNAKV